MSDETRTKAQSWFPIIAIVCVVLMVIFVVSGIYMQRSVIPWMKKKQVATRLHAIGTAMTNYAKANGGQYQSRGAAYRRLRESRDVS
jgi:hypothetical protein